MLTHLAQLVAAGCFLAGLGVFAWGLAKVVKLFRS